MTRISKIARLPHDLREQLNRRLQDGEVGKSSVKWLNASPAARAVLRAEFGGRPVTEQNLSDWRSAGYRDWLVQQETMEQIQRLAAEAKEMGAAAPLAFGDQLAVWVTGRYAVALRHLVAAEGKSVADCAVLRELCQHVVALRRGDHSAGRLAIERERLALDQAQNKQNWEAEFWEWAKRPEVREKIESTPDDDEVILAVRRRLWGHIPEDNLPNGVKPTGAESPSQKVEGAALEAGEEAGSDPG